LGQLPLHHLVLKPVYSTPASLDHREEQWSGLPPVSTPSLLVPSASHEIASLFRAVSWGHPSHMSDSIHVFCNHLNYEGKGQKGDLRIHISPLVLDTSSPNAPAASPREKQ
jgi:hypothetical protein